MNTTRQELLEVLTELTELYPNMRFGQLVANVSYRAKGPYKESIWDVTDEEWLRAAREHLEKASIA